MKVEKTQSLPLRSSESRGKKSSLIIIIKWNKGKDKHVLKGVVTQKGGRGARKVSQKWKYLSWVSKMVGAPHEARNCACV